MKKLDALPLETGFDGQSFALYRDGEKLSPNVRTVGDMADVLRNKEFAESHSAEPAYFMYRNVMRPADKQFSGVGYDITIIRPLDLGGEYCKTLGHYHAVEPRSGHTFPEVYEVLEGKAIYLLQKLLGTNDPSKADGEVEEVIAVYAGKGDKVVIPPDYGHVSVNASLEEPLVMSNVPDGAVGKGDYSLLRKKAGAAYFFLSDGTVDGNKSFRNLPGLRRFTAASFPPSKLLAGEAGVNLYASFLGNPGKYGFLLEPSKYYNQDSGK